MSKPLAKTKNQFGITDLALNRTLIVSNCNLLVTEPNAEYLDDSL